MNNKAEDQSSANEMPMVNKHEVYSGKQMYSNALAERLTRPIVWAVMPSEYAVSTLRFYLPATLLNCQPRLREF